MKVLVLDDSVDDLMQIRRVLSDMPDIEASYLQDPAKALSSMREDLVDVLISDINMPEMSGIELIDQLRELEGDGDARLPTIFLTGASSEKQAESLLKGGDVVLVKPVVPPVLQAQLKAFERLVMQRRKLLDENQGLKRDVVVDELTGLMNARGLQGALAERLPSAENLCVLAIDIENLGAYIDHHGRTHGEVAIQTVAAAVRFSVNMDTDFAVRYGGQEFVVCLPNQGVGEARAVAQTIIDTLDELEVTTPSNTQGKLTVGIGMAVGPATADCFDTLLEQADYAMGAAKAAGHSQIAFYRMSGKPVVYTTNANS